MPSSSLMPRASTEVVRLSSWAFTLWWLFILGVHVVTCVYNALYSYVYWKLGTLFINLYLESFQIGMPSPYHHRIAIVHAIMSALHGICILLMLAGTIKYRSLAFTPGDPATQTRRARRRRLAEPAPSSSRASTRSTPKYPTATASWVSMGTTSTPSTSAAKYSKLRFKRSRHIV